MKQNWKRLIALLLVLVMGVSLIPAAAAAEAETDLATEPTGATEQETQPEETVGEIVSPRPLADRIECVGSFCPEIKKQRTACTVLCFLVGVSGFVCVLRHGAQNRG